MKKFSTELKEIISIKRGIELGQNADLVQCKKCGCWNEAGTKYYNKVNLKTCKKCSKSISLTNIICISNKTESESYKIKCISGKELQRYSINSNYFIIPDLSGIDYKKDIFAKEKIFLKRIATRPIGTLVKDVILAFNTVYCLYNPTIDIKYLLGLLNSKLMGFYYEKTFNLGSNLTTQITIENLGKFPIKKIDERNTKEKDLSNRIASLVDQILSLNEKLSGSQDPHGKTLIERQIAAAEG